jgi:hypothetical protein
MPLFKKPTQKVREPLKKSHEITQKVSRLSKMDCWAASARVAMENGDEYPVNPVNLDQKSSSSA